MLDKLIDQSVSPASGLNVFRQVTTHRLLTQH